jgi:type IV pilus assembly protein PilA
MLKTIHRMQRNERGFTLVELLIVIAIIAILAAIAIPEFSKYRKSGIEASMVADAKNIATAFEAVFADCQAYPSLTTTTGPAIVQLTAPGGCSAPMPKVGISTGNTASVSVGTPTNGYTVTIENNNARENRTKYTLDNEGTTNWQ